MSVSDKVSNGYFKCIDKLWTDKELCDFTVQIDDEYIQCHRVILAACSPFFLGLLRSGMKEANEGRVVLQDISVSTFELILKTLYTGEDVLSLDNFIEIWHASHMLQIGFLTDACETFAGEKINLDNFKEIVSSAKLLDSKDASTSIKNYMLKNFDAVFENKLYLELSFEELFSLIDSRELNVSSEYVVLQAILNWAEYKPAVHKSDALDITIEKNKKLKTETVKRLHDIITDAIQESCVEDRSTIVTDKSISCLNKNDNELIQPKRKETLKSNSCNSNSSISENKSNDRVHRLEDLMNSVRACIIRPTLLVKALVHHIINHNDKAKQIIVSAILNQTMYFEHGQWPTAGIYRTSNEYGNYGVCSLYSNGTFEATDPDNEKWYTLKKCAWLKRNVKLVAFEKELYAIGNISASQTKSKMFVYGNNWKQINELQGTEFYLISNENYIYITNVAEHVLYRFDPKYTDVNFVKFTDVPEKAVVTHVMNYQIYLLFFCTETVNGVEETAVHMLDIQAKSWSKLDNFDGPAKNIISFRNDDNHFVLQTTGSLWVLNKSEGVSTFSCVEKLWSLDHVLIGAVVYGEKLVIFYHDPDDKKDSFVRKVGNMFSYIRYWSTDTLCSKFCSCCAA